MNGWVMLWFPYIHCWQPVRGWVAEINPEDIVAPGYCWVM